MLEIDHGLRVSISIRLLAHLAWLLYHIKEKGRMLFWMLGKKKRESEYNKSILKRKKGKYLIKWNKVLLSAKILFLLDALLIDSSNSTKIVVIKKINKDSVNWQHIFIWQGPLLLYGAENEFTTIFFSCAWIGWIIIIGLLWQNPT